MLLLSTGAAHALVAAERLRKAVETMASTWHDRAPRITISGGLAVDSGKGGFEQLVELADSALYRAKQLGRNRVECDGAAMVA